MTGLDIGMIALSSVLMLVGLIGCVIPGVPGTPLCWFGLLAASFAPKSTLGWVVLVVTAVVTVIVEIVNNFVPSFFTNKAGGSKAGAIGSTVGVFVGLFTGNPLGILLGPFLGALVGELIHDHSDMGRALSSAGWAFLGFITGSGLRLIVSAIFTVIMVKSFF